MRNEIANREPMVNVAIATCKKEKIIRSLDSLVSGLNSKILLVPTYQYECTSCQHAFELVQSFSDAPISECPECQNPVRKVYSNVGIVFKGSGFYKTDSRTKSESTSTTSSTPTTTAAAPKTETKSETPKPATKSESSAN